MSIKYKCWELVGTPFSEWYSINLVKQIMWLVLLFTEYHARWIWSILSIGMGKFKKET